MPTAVQLYGAATVPGPTRGEGGWETLLTTDLVLICAGVDGTTCKVNEIIFPYLNPTSTTLAASATLTPTYPCHKVKGSTGAVTIAGIAAGSKDGQLLILVGDHATSTVTILSTATGVQLANGDITLGQYEELELRWDSTLAKWVERSRAPTNRLTNQQGLALYEARANGTNKITLKAPDALAADLTFKLPTADVAGYLKSDGAGNLSLVAATATMDDTYNAGHSITVDAGNILLTGATGLTTEILSIIQPLNYKGVYINKTGTGAGHALDILNAGTGSSINVWHTLAGSSAVFVHNDTTSIGLEVVQDGAGKGISVHQNADAIGIDLQISAASTTSGLWVTNAGTGSGVYVHQTGTGYGISVTQDGGAPGLYITQNSPTYAARIDQTASGVGLYIWKEGSGAGAGISVHNDGTGAGITITQDGIAHGIDIVQNAASSCLYLDKQNSGVGVALWVHNDGTGYGISIDQDGNANALYIDNGGSSDSIATAQGNEHLGLDGVWSDRSCFVEYKADITPISTDDAFLEKFKRLSFQKYVDKSVKEKGITLSPRHGLFLDELIAEFGFGSHGVSGTEVASLAVGGVKALKTALDALVLRVAALEKPA